MKLALIILAWYFIIKCFKSHKGIFIAEINFFKNYSDYFSSFGPLILNVVNCSVIEFKYTCK